MRLLVTGSEGFIGRHLVRSSRSQGLGVEEIDRALAGRTHNEADSSFRSSELLNIPHTDLPDVDVVVHLAGRPGVRSSWGEYDSYLRDNAVTTERLLDAYSRRQTPPRFILASSSSVYGSSPGQRLESATSARLRPASPYGASKVAAEAVASAYAQRGFEVTVLRFFTVYGPGQRDDMAIRRMIAAATSGGRFQVLGTGQQARHFTFVADTVDAILAAVSHRPSDALEIFDVASSDCWTVLECVDIVEEAVGREVQLDFLPRAVGDPHYTAPSTSHTRDRLGWSSRVGLVEGIRRQADSVVPRLPTNGNA